MESLHVLLITAGSIGVVHTLLGPDHYLPFAAMARAGRWSARKTAWITLLCGFGHVASSVVVGLAGLALGWALGRLEAIESARGEWAGWVLLATGLTYGAWGVHRALKRQTHRHVHRHADGTVHEHEHNHEHHHAHVHDSASARFSPWFLFVAFVLGPCEPLIPLLLIPALSLGYLELALVVAAFAFATLSTMLAMVWLLGKGLDLLPVTSLERWNHALAGLALVVCGASVALLGL